MYVDGFDVTLPPNSYETDVTENFSTEVLTTDDPMVGTYYQNPAGPLMYTLVVIFFYILSLFLLMAKSIHDEKKEANESLHYQEYIKKDDFVYKVKRVETSERTDSSSVTNSSKQLSGRENKLRSYRFSSRDLTTLQEV